MDGCLPYGLLFRLCIAHLVSLRILQLQNGLTMNYELYITAFLLSVNVIAFFMYGIDKWKAKKDKWRTSEATLLWLAIIGGSIGAWLGMKVWHHKTMHKKFRYGLPLIIIVQIALIIFAYEYIMINQ